MIAVGFILHIRFGGLPKIIFFNDNCADKINRQNGSLLLLKRIAYQLFAGIFICY